jgi:hypothetical protein
VVVAKADLLPIIAEGIVRQIQSGLNPLAARKKPPSELEQSQAAHLAGAKAHIAFAEAHSLVPFSPRALLAQRKGFVTFRVRGGRSVPSLVQSTVIRTRPAPIRSFVFTSEARSPRYGASLVSRSGSLSRFVAPGPGLGSFRERRRWIYGIP